MGARWPLELVDARGARWVGDHRPRWADLRGIFAKLVELPLGAPVGEEALRAAFGDLVDSLEAASPSRFRLHLRNATIRQLTLEICAPRVPEGRIALGGSAARRRLELGQRLRAVGIETPRPIGFLEREKRAAASPSLLVTERVPAATLLEVRDQRLTALPSLAPDGLAVYGGGPPMRVSDKRALIRAVAELVRRLHATEIFLGPVRAENVLVARDAVLVADLEPPPRRLRARAAEEALDALNRDFENLTRADRMRFLDAYLRLHGARRALRRELFRALASRRTT